MNKLLVWYCTCMCTIFKTNFVNLLQYRSNVRWQSRLDPRSFWESRIEFRGSSFDFRGSRTKFRGSSFEVRDTRRIFRGSRTEISRKRFNSRKQNNSDEQNNWRAALCISQIEASPSPPPPGHTPGIWRLFLPGREGIWSLVSISCYEARWFHEGW